MQDEYQVAHPLTGQLEIECRLFLLIAQSNEHQPEKKMRISPSNISNYDNNWKEKRNNNEVRSDNTLERKKEDYLVSYYFFIY